MVGMNNVIMAEAYIVDWDGARHSNGNPMRFSPENVAILMGKDEHLQPFISTHAKRISPPWPNR